MSFLFFYLTEQDQHDVREDVESTETLLQTEHYQERARTKASVQVRYKGKTPLGDSLTVLPFECRPHVSSRDFQQPQRYQKVFL